jgi:hypothetical protein
MPEDKLFTPPEKWWRQEEGRVIYLGGTQGAWQNKATEILTATDPELLIARPYNTEWPDRNAIKEKFVMEPYQLQVEWNVAHMRLASSMGGLMFWFDKEETSPIAIFEFAEWLTNYKWRKKTMPENTIKLAIGVDDDYNNAMREYMLHRVFEDCPEISIATSIEDLVKLMIEQWG